ncbi:hypothetical protein FIBSPDRAFT_921889 [Athelia psychrophila]|uniref:Amino acid permease/ SLC12A domain-containing protein n=1 Tax=Athelia psychrophila TaxID=1759441 RepID=A0A166B8G5_9AGAM|nr:hypothetical protein FIBSPDRAFT_921889 [Fibularhizoctonia sp. CBS 109695]
MLNLAQLLGAGIYSVPGSVLSSVGSISSANSAGLSVYVEFASMFPNRSGAEVVYLEMSFPRPRFFVPMVFMLSTVLLLFSAPNAIIFSQTNMQHYFLVICGWEVTSSRQTAAVIGVTTFAVIGVALSTKWSLRIVNLLTSMKVMSSIFMVLTGVAVLCGFTGVPNPYANFHDIFEGSTTNLNSLATAFVKINYSYIGWHNSFNVLGEVRGANPVRTIRRAGHIALACIIRQVARQGLLPYPAFFASTKPFGTPIGPVALKYMMTVFVPLVVLGKDAFNFMVDLSSYPSLIFTCALVIGLVLLRKRGTLQGFARSAYQAGKFFTSLFFLSAVLLLVMPWVPLEKGKGDLCAFYYYLCIVWLPNFWGYTIVEEIEELDDGARTMRLVHQYHAKDTDQEEGCSLLQGEQ